MTAPRVAVLDYGIGNLRSAQKTLERAGADPVLTRDPEEVSAAAGVVLPGVGAFGRVMEAIRETGVDDIAHAAVAAGTPFMGICVGMQALYESSEENPGVDGLGILPGTIRRLTSAETRIKVPQMQWNRLDLRGESPLFAKLPEDPWVYFVHSYAPEATDDVIATCEYGGTVTAAAARGNVMATQFHPEKSGRVGVQIITNFVELCRDPAWSERPERSGGESAAAAQTPDPAWSERPERSAGESAADAAAVQTPDPAWSERPERSAGESAADAAAAQTPDPAWSERPERSGKQ